MINPITRRSIAREIAREALGFAERLAYMSRGRAEDIRTADQTDQKRRGLRRT
ncbi:MAG: hypothetical protein RLO08_17605 [Parvibaculaceae bacterium]|jgi:hypothetical protein